MQTVVHRVLDLLKRDTKTKLGIANKRLKAWMGHFLPQSASGPLKSRGFMRLPWAPSIQHLPDENRVDAFNRIEKEAGALNGADRVKVLAALAVHIGNLPKADQQA